MEDTLIKAERSAERSLFSHSVISLHLKELNYSQKSIDSMNMCGKVIGHMLKSCGCGNEIITLKHRCSLRTCLECAKIRKNKLRRKYLSFLNGLAQNKTYSLYFLTISPRNFGNLGEGMIHVRKSLIKFLRTDYIKERIKAGLYVIETKHHKDTNWNIHIHMIIYGRRLDNQIRGKCFDCSQNLIKQDYITKRYYCANKSCNSSNVVFHKNSKLVDLFKTSLKREVNINIQHQDSALGSLNYLLKYISANEDSFSTPLEMARYIKETYKRKLVNVFGLFFKHKFKKVKCICYKCNSEISFCYDFEVINKFLDSIKPPNNKNDLCYL